MNDRHVSDDQTSKDRSFFSCLLKRYVYICMEWLRYDWNLHMRHGTQGIFILIALFESNGTDRKSVGLKTQSWSQGKSQNTFEWKTKRHMGLSSHTTCLHEPNKISMSNGKLWGNKGLPHTQNITTYTKHKGKE